MRLRLMLGGAVGGLLVLGFGMVPVATAGEGPAFQGATACKKCHFNQHKSWKASTMAQAFEVLRPGERGDAKTAAGLDPNKDYTADPNCLPCHTTGYEKPGGFVSIEETPDLAGVGCEMCHGPGESYLEIMTVKYKNHPIKEMTDRGMIYPPKEAQCLQCHNDESPFNRFIEAKYAFDFETRVRDEAGTHKHKRLKGEHPDLPGLGAVFQE